MEENEIWKDIEGYEELYQVSNFGRVKRLDSIITDTNGKQRFVSGRVLTAITNKLGYQKVKLCKYNHIKNCSVHRLVAEAFMPNPDNLPQVNHINEDKTDNRVENLEWCTAKYNSNYGTHPEKLRVSSTGRKLPDDAVQRMADKHKKKICAFKNGHLIYCFDSAADANRYNSDFSYIGISACCNGRLKSYRGLEWKFI